MRVLGIDPGLTRCGVGVVEGTPGRAPTLVGVGVIRTSGILSSVSACRCSRARSSSGSPSTAPTRWRSNVSSRGGT